VSRSKRRVGECGRPARNSRLADLCGPEARTTRKLERDGALGQWTISILASPAPRAAVFSPRGNPSARGLPPGASPRFGLPLDDTTFAPARHLPPLPPPSAVAIMPPSAGAHFQAALSLPARRRTTPRPLVGRPAAPLQLDLRHEGLHRGRLRGLTRRRCAVPRPEFQ